jgi:hypothetical protein
MGRSLSVYQWKRPANYVWWKFWEPSHELVKIGEVPLLRPEPERIQPEPNEIGYT